MSRKISRRQAHSFQKLHVRWTDLQDSVNDDTDQSA